MKSATVMKIGNRYYIFLIFVLISVQRGAFDLLINSRIVNGQNGNISDFRYQLSLQIYNKHVCGGSVLTSKWAITAAHCIKGFEYSPNFVSLRGGSTYHNNGGTRISVKTIKIHPLYDHTNYNYDVALLFTSDEISGNYIQSIGLPEINDQPIVNSIVIASGWGQTDSGNTILPNTLQFVELTVIDQNECKNRLLEYGVVLSNMFCAFEHDKDTCQGDSGGGIQANNILIGVVSWGVDCGLFPGVYTRLAYPGIRIWIKVLTGI